MAQFTVAALDEPAVGAMLATLMFGLSLLFNVAMQPPSQLPQFWIFMYRVSPFTYYVSGISSTALHGRPDPCNDVELKVFDPPPGQTCGEYKGLIHGLILGPVLFSLSLPTYNMPLRL